MNIKERNYPTGSDSIALIKQIKIKEGISFDLTPIVKYIFGKSLLVRNQDVANRYAKEYKLHCVTPDGQMVYAGAYMMRAGFHDSKKERIRLYGEYSKYKSEIFTLKEKLSILNKQKDQFLTQDSNYLRNVQGINIEKDKSNARLQELKNQETNLKNLRLEYQKKISELEAIIEIYQKDIIGIEENINITKVEISRKEIGELSNNETKELESLIYEVEELEKQHKVINTKKIEIERKIKELEQNCSSFLPERERKLEESISDCTMILESRDEAEIEEDYRQINKLVENCEINMQKTSQDLMDLKLQIRDSEDKLKNKRENKQRITHEINEISTEIEKISLKLMN